MKRKIAVLNINNDAFSALTAMNYNQRQVLAQRFRPHELELAPFMLYSEMRAEANQTLARIPKTTILNCDDVSILVDD